MSSLFNPTTGATNYDFGGGSTAGSDEATSSMPLSSSYVTEAAHVGLTDQQEIVLSLLPIPTSLLSIFGSMTIIYMACQARNGRGSTATGTGGGSRSVRSIATVNTSDWTPYTRLLIAMSITDIIFSISYALNPFLVPKATSKRVWAMGNDVTCSTLGFFTQFTLSTMLFNGMLSFYFLLTSRYGWKNHEIAKRWYLEPLMHAFSLGYPLITATVGSVLGVYNEMLVGQGCWVKGWPDGCGEGPGEVPCKSPLIAYIFGGVVLVLSFLSISCNNVMIYSFVRRQTRTKHKSKANRSNLLSSSATSSNNSASSNSIIGRRIVSRGRRSRQNTTHSGTSKESDTFASTAAIVPRRQLAAPTSLPNKSEADKVRLDDSSSSSSESSDSVIDGQINNVSNANSGNVAAEQFRSAQLAETKEDDNNSVKYDDVKDNDTDVKTMEERIEERTKQRQEHVQELVRQRQQLKRLELVSSQARLYVGAFFVSNIWPLVLRVLESQSHNEEDELEAQMYTLLVLQNIFFPMQGFWNLLVYVRPKYLKCRKEYPQESKLWALRRAMYGNSIEPTIEYHHQHSMGRRRDAAISAISHKTGKIVFLPPPADEEVKDSSDIRNPKSVSDLSKQNGTDSIDLKFTNKDGKIALNSDKEHTDVALSDSEGNDGARESPHTEASRANSSFWPRWGQEKRPSLLGENVKKDVAPAPVRRLPREYISSITASVGDFTESSDHGEEDLEDMPHEIDRVKETPSASKKSTKPIEWSWVTTKKGGPRSRSGASSLEMISELSELSLVEATEEEDHVSSGILSLSGDVSVSSSVKRVRFQGQETLDEAPSNKPSSSRRWGDDTSRSKQMQHHPQRVERRSSPIELESPFSPGDGLRRWNSASALTDRPAGDILQLQKDQPRCAQRRASPLELVELSKPSGVLRWSSADDRQQPRCAKRRESPEISALLLPPDQNQMSSSLSLDMSFDRMEAAMAPASTDAPMQRPSRRTSPIYIESDCTVQTV